MAIIPVLGQAECVVASFRDDQQASFDQVALRLQDLVSEGSVVSPQHPAAGVEALAYGAGESGWKDQDIGLGGPEHVAGLGQQRHRQLKSEYTGGEK